jgi:hypothetical protein
MLLRRLRCADRSLSLDIAAAPRSFRPDMRRCSVTSFLLVASTLALALGPHGLVLCLHPGGALHITSSLGQGSHAEPGACLACPAAGCALEDGTPACTVCLDVELKGSDQWSCRSEHAGVLPMLRQAVVSLPPVPADHALTLRRHGHLVGQVQPAEAHGLIIARTTVLLL